MWLHEFWTTNFPQFVEQAYFIYYILDLMSIVVFFKLMFALPGYMLIGRNRVIYRD